MSDIVERLLKMADHNANDYAIGHYWNAVEEAAAEIERLRSALNRHTELLDKTDAELVQSRLEIERLRSENERLRGLLRDLLVSETLNNVWHLRVREALGEKP